MPYRRAKRRKYGRRYPFGKRYSRTTKRKFSRRRVSSSRRLKSRRKRVYRKKASSTAAKALYLAKRLDRATERKYIRKSSRDFDLNLDRPQPVHWYGSDLCKFFPLTTCMPDCDYVPPSLAEDDLPLITTESYLIANPSSQTRVGRKIHATKFHMRLKFIWPTLPQTVPTSYHYPLRVRFKLTVVQFRTTLSPAHIALLNQEVDPDVSDAMTDKINDIVPNKSDIWDDKFLRKQDEGTLFRGFTQTYPNLPVGGDFPLAREPFYTAVNDPDPSAAAINEEQVRQLLNKSMNLPKNKYSFRRSRIVFQKQWTMKPPQMVNEAAIREPILGQTTQIDGTATPGILPVGAPTYDIALDADTVQLTANAAAINDVGTHGRYTTWPAPKIVGFSFKPGNLVFPPIARQAAAFTPFDRQVGFPLDPEGVPDAMDQMGQARSASLLAIRRGQIKWQPWMNLPTNGYYLFLQSDCEALLDATSMEPTPRPYSNTGPGNPTSTPVIPRMTWESKMTFTDS